MINLEWLKNINFLLSQVIDLAEDEFSAEKWLDVAANVAKKLNRFSINPYSSLPSRESPVDIYAPNPMGQSDSISTGPGMNLMDLWKLLKPAQNLFKQISTLEPAIQAIMNPSNTKPANLKPSSISNSGDNFYLKKTVLNWLALALLPIFLVNLSLKFR